MTQTHDASARAHSLGAGLATLRARWGWIVAFGVLLSICGIVALGSVFTATVASVFVVGIMMMVAGIGEIIEGFAMKTWGKFFLWILLGAMYVVAGLVTINNPLLASAVLTLILGAGLAASGIVRIVLAFQMKEGTPWIWVALSGVVTTLLGAMILAK